MGIFPRGTLRLRLMALVLLAGVPALGLALYSSFEQRHLARMAARDDARILARLVSRDQEHLVQNTRHVLLILSRLPAIRNAMLNPAECDALLAAMLKEYPSYVNFGVANAQGMIVCSAAPMPEPVTVADRAWFQRAARARKFAVGEYQIGRVTGKATINFAQPFFDARGRLHGVVFAAMDLNWLQQVGASADLPPDAVVLIADTGGTTLARYPQIARADGVSPPDAPTLAAIRAGEGDSMTDVLGLDGVRRLFIFMPLGKSIAPADGSTAYLAVGIPIASVYAAADYGQKRNLLVFLSAGAIALVGVWFASSVVLLRPVKALMRATRRVAKGDLAARAEPAARVGELAELALAFDSMAAALEQDRTEYDRAMTELRHQRQEQREIFDSVPAVILYKDTENRHLRANKAAAATMNLPVDAIEGRSAFDMYPRELAEQYYRDDMEVINSDQPKQGIVESLMSSSGQRRWMRTDKIPYRDTNGTVIGVIVFAVDITQQKQAEEDLIALNAQLERRVAERTAELVQTMDALQASHQEREAARIQLIHAEKMHLVGRLAAGVAHEVKNPLVVIGMGLSYLATQPGMNDGEGATVMRQCTEAVQRASSVIRGLLDFSVPGRLKLAPCAINDLVDRSLILVQHELSRKGIALKKEPAQDLPPIAVDANKIQQVLLNLFMNAIHAMPTGGTLAVRSRQYTLPDGREEILVEVSDTGPGIPQELIGKVFDPFFTTKPTGKGTGLGLSVSKTIVDLHGGNIDIRNCPSGGACVTLRFIAQQGASDHGCEANSVD